LFFRIREEPAATQPNPNDISEIASLDAGAGERRPDDSSWNGMGELLFLKKRIHSLSRRSFVNFSFLSQFSHPYVIANQLRMAEGFSIIISHEFDQF
jgi:hypothetical protein